MLHPILGVLTRIINLSPCSFMCVYVSATLDYHATRLWGTRLCLRGLCFLHMGFRISTYQHDRPTHYSHPTPPDRRTTIGLVVPRWVCNCVPDDYLIYLDYVAALVDHAIDSYFIIQNLWGGRQA